MFTNGATKSNDDGMENPEIETLTPSTDSEISVLIETAKLLAADSAAEAKPRSASTSGAFLGQRSFLGDQSSRHSEDTSNSSSEDNSDGSSPSSLKRRLRDLPPPDEALKSADRAAALNRRVHGVYLHLQGLSNRIEERDEAEDTSVAISNSVVDRGRRKDARARRRERMSKELGDRQVATSPERSSKEIVPRGTSGDDGSSDIAKLRRDRESVGDAEQGDADFEAIEPFKRPWTTSSAFSGGVRQRKAEGDDRDAICEGLRRQSVFTLPRSNRDDGTDDSSGRGIAFAPASSPGVEFPAFASRARRIPAKIGGYRPASSVVIQHLSSGTEESDGIGEKIVGEALHPRKLRPITLRASPGSDEALESTRLGDKSRSSDPDAISLGSASSPSKIEDAARIVGTEEATTNARLKSPSTISENRVVFIDADRGADLETTGSVVLRRVDVIGEEGKTEWTSTFNENREKATTGSIRSDRFFEDALDPEETTIGFEGLQNSLRSRADLDAFPVSSPTGTRAECSPDEENPCNRSPITPRLQTFFGESRGSSSTRLSRSSGWKVIADNASQRLDESNVRPVNSQVREPRSSLPSSGSETPALPLSSKTRNATPILTPPPRNSCGPASRIRSSEALTREKASMATSKSTSRERSVPGSAGTYRKEFFSNVLNSSDGLNIPMLDIGSQELSQTTSMGSREDSAKQPLDVHALIRALSDVSLKRENAENFSSRDAERTAAIPRDGNRSGSSGPRSSEYTPAANGSAQSLVSLEADESYGKLGWSSRTSGRSSRRILWSGDRSPKARSSRLPLKIVEERVDGSNACGTSWKHSMMEVIDALDYRPPVAKVTRTDLTGSRHPVGSDAVGESLGSCGTLERVDWSRRGAKQFSSRTDDSDSRGSKSSKRSTRSFKSLPSSGKIAGKKKTGLRTKTEILEDLQPLRKCLDPSKVFPELAEEPAPCSNSIERRLEGGHCENQSDTRGGRSTASNSGNATRRESILKGSARRMDISDANSSLLDERSVDSFKGSGKRSKGRNSKSRNEVRPESASKREIIDPKSRSSIEDRSGDSRSLPSESLSCQISPGKTNRPWQTRKLRYSFDNFSSSPDELEVVPKKACVRLDDLQDRGEVTLLGAGALLEKREEKKSSIRENSWSSRVSENASTEENVFLEPERSADVEEDRINALNSRNDVEEICNSMNSLGAAPKSENNIENDMISNTDRTTPISFRSSIDRKAASSRIEARREIPGEFSMAELEETQKSPLKRVDKTFQNATPSRIIEKETQCSESISNEAASPQRQLIYRPKHDFSSGNTIAMHWNHILGASELEIKENRCSKYTSNATKSNDEVTVPEDVESNVERSRLTSASSREAIVDAELNKKFPPKNPVAASARNSYFSSSVASSSAEEVEIDERKDQGQIESVNECRFAHRPQICSKCRVECGIFVKSSLFQEFPKECIFNPIRENAETSGTKFSGASFEGENPRVPSRLEGSSIDKFREARVVPMKSVRSESATHLISFETSPCRAMPTKTSSSASKLTSMTEALGARRKSQERFPFTISEGTSRKSSGHVKQVAQEESFPGRAAAMKRDASTQIALVRYGFPTLKESLPTPTKRANSVRSEIASCVSYGGRHAERRNLVPLVRGLVRKFSAKLKRSGSRGDRASECSVTRVLYKNEECRDHSAKRSFSDSFGSGISSDRLTASRFAKVALDSSTVSSGKSLKSKRSREHIAVSLETPGKGYSRDDLWIQEFDSDDEESRKTREKEASRSDDQPSDRYSVFLAKGSFRAERDGESGDVLVNGAEDIGVEEGDSPRQKAPVSSLIQEVFDGEDSEEDQGCLCVRFCRSCDRSSVDTKKYRMYRSSMEQDPRRRMRKKS